MLKILHTSAKTKEMNLPNFESHINPTILSRGKNYFNSGAVSSIENTENGTWEATVEGNESYEVEIEIASANQEVESYYCDCPYSDICKHVVAVLYEIRREMSKSPEKSKEKAKKVTSFSSLLLKPTLAELHTFLANYAEKDKAFKTDFEVYFADKDDNVDYVEKYKHLVKQIIAKHSKRGFVEYRDAINLGREMDSLFAANENLIDKGNLLAAFALAKVGLRELVELIPNSDDSNGDIGGAIHEATRFLKEILEKADEQFATEIFDFLVKETLNTDYFDYGDMGYELVEIIEDIATKYDFYADYMQYLDTRMIAAKKKTYSSYDIERIVNLKVAFLKATDRKDEAEAIIEANMEMVSFRKARIAIHLQQKDYGTAIKLINQGIEIAEKLSHPGTVSDWKKMLLQIAESQADTAQIRKLSHYFAFDRGLNLEHYRKWKNTFTEEDWKIAIHAKIEDLSTKHKSEKAMMFYEKMPSSTLCKIYVEEAMWEDLFKAVAAYPSLNFLDEYSSYLLPTYTTELTQMYLPILENMANKSDGRGSYVEWVNTAKKVCKKIPSTQIPLKQIAQKTILKYPRKKAMIEEFQKFVNGK